MVRRSASLVALAALVLAVTGCGGGSSAGGGAGGNQASACVILANGNQLCGQAAIAYCRRFETQPPDAQTAQACSSVDPTGSYQAPLPPPSQPGGIACDQYPTAQQQDECVKAETGQ